MEGAIPVNRKKRGRPRVDSTLVGVRLPPDQLAILDAWVDVQPDPKPSRPEAIRQLLQLSLGAIAAKVATRKKLQ